MEANTRQLEAIFDPNVFFQVPLFQRPYVWNEGENWEPLWDDIQALLDRQLRTGKSRPHFLGAIVLEQLPHPAGSIETRLVIDGQQRFTTLQLFLMAARNLAQASAAMKYANRFTGLVENDSSRVEVKEEKFKLWPTNSDRDAFQAIHGCVSLDDVEKAVKAKPQLAQSNLMGAYRYFHVKLADWLAGKGIDPDDKAELTGKSLDERLEALWQIVKSGLQLVVINLGADDETQVIFETLNARGTALLPADLIKNYLFRRAQIEQANVEALYEEHWARFETQFWREEVQQGRISRPRLDVFVSHYLTLMTRDEVKSTHLFNAFKNFAEDPDVAPMTAAEQVKQLVRYADIFHTLYHPATHLELKRFVDLLEAVDTSTVFPFLLHAYAELMPEDKAGFNAILVGIESFLMRRMVTNWTSKNYNRLFVELLKGMDKAGEVSAQVMGEWLAKGQGDSTRFPTDLELLNAVFEQPLYGRIAKYKVRAILESLEMASQSKKSPVLAFTEKLTIEHVLPQTWQTYWPLPAEDKADPVKEQRATARRDAMLNTLGNLTLITGAFNSSLQNAAWSLKRPELLKYAKLNLTQYFHKPELNNWNEDAIQERTRHLFELMFRMWPYPVKE